MTPHNEAKLGDYAPVVLMPGDPLRAKWIAETFFDNPKLVNSIRNCLGYTGTYKGKPVSVQASGMGQPSLGIYTHELYNTYNVDTVIRVGSCGGISDKVRLNDIVIALTACTDSAMTKNILPGFQFAPCGDFELIKKYIEALPIDIRYWVGSISSNDYFYQPDTNWWKPMSDAGILAVEMETHVLYSMAMRFNKRALSVNTVSDHLNGKHGEMLPKERQEGFETMIITTLESML